MLAAALLLLATTSVPDTPGAPGTPVPPPAAVRSAPEAAAGEADMVEVWDGDLLVALLPAGVDPASVRTNTSPRWRTVRPGDVAVSVPAGALTVTSAPGAGSSSAVTVTDSRPGELGFAATVTVDRRARLVGVWAEQVPGNAMRASDVTTARRAVLTPSRPVRVAGYPARTSLGSVRLGVELDEPATVTWTVL